MIKKEVLIPNIVTAGNIFMGYLSILESIKGNFVTSIWFIILAMFFDSIDGQVARKFNAFTEFGKEFDSFCDAFSFGLAPALLIYFLLEKEMNGSIFVVLISFVYAICGVIRLARFNIDTISSSEKSDFVGMPIPNAAGMICSYILVCNAIEKNLEINFFNLKFFVAIIVIASILMISTIPFKVPTKIFDYLPKERKWLITLILVIILALKYFLFIFSFGYVIVTLINFFRRNNDKY